MNQHWESPQDPVKADNVQARAGSSNPQNEVFPIDV
jgi:hypothetical protein